MTMVRLSPRVKQAVRDADYLCLVPSISLPHAFMACVGKAWPLRLLEVPSIRNQAVRSTWRSMATARNSGHDVRSRLWYSPVFLNLCETAAR